MKNVLISTVNKNIILLDFPEVKLIFVKI